MKLNKNILLTTLVLIFASALAQAKLTYSHSGSTYTVDSKYYSITVSGQWSGRILSFVDKATNKDITFDGGPGRPGGLLDDRHGFTYHSYHSSAMRHSSKLVRLRFAHNEKGYSVVKYITFRAGSPVIEVKQQYENSTQSPTIFWTRNFVTPGGEPVSKDRTKGFMSLKSGWFDKYPSEYYPKLRSNWAAVIDQPTKVGFAAVVDKNLLDKFYFWHGGKEKATFEWVRKPIPAGRKVEGTSYLVLLRNVDKVTLVTKDIAANVQPKIDNHEVSVDGKVMALSPSTKKATISARITNSRGVEVAKFAKQDVSFDGVEKPVDINIVKASQKLGDGKYVLLATVKIGKYTYKAAPVKFEIGNKTGDTHVALPPVMHSHIKTQPIKGWVDKITRFGITDKQKQKGFWLSRGSDKHEKLLTDMPVKVAVGLNETQAAHFTVNGLKDLKDISISLEAKGELANHLKFYQENHWHKLEPLKSVTFASGTEKNIWIIFNPDGLKAGKYNQDLKLTIGDNSISVPFLAHVYPVKLPTKRYIGLKPYTFWHRMGHGYEMTDKRINRLKIVIGALAKMGASMMNWDANPYDILPKVKLKSSGELVSKYVKKHKLDLDNLPDLDFSYFAPVFDIYHKNGITRFDKTQQLYPMKRNAGRIKKIWFKHNSKVKVGTPQMDKILIWYYGQLKKYAQSKGFKTFFAKVSDEFGVHNIPAYIKSAKLMRKAGYRPYSTITGAIPQTPQYIRQLAPYVDLWVVHYGQGMTFINLTHKKYRLDKKTVPLNKWRGQYKNGSAKHTWVTRFFGSKTTYAHAQVDSMEVLEDGKPLKYYSGSPWGNTKRGCYYMTGSSLYVSPSKGSVKDHKYKVNMKIHVLDKNGKQLIKLKKGDQIRLYRGLAPVSTYSYNYVRTKGWITAYLDLPGYGFWTYFWNQGTSNNNMVFYNVKNKTLIKTPVYWGVRDGWEESQYLAELTNQMSEQQRQKALAQIMGRTSAAPLQLNKDNKRTKINIKNRKSPQVWFEAKQRLLNATSRPKFT